MCANESEATNMFLPDVYRPFDTAEVVMLLNCQGNNASTVYLIYSLSERVQTGDHKANSHDVKNALQQH